MRGVLSKDGAGGTRPPRCGGRWCGRGRVAGPPRVLASCKVEPAHTRKQDGVRGARAAAKGAGATAGAASSVLPPGGSEGGDGRASGPRIWAWPGTYLLESQKIDPLVVKRARRKSAWRRRGWLVIEPRSAVLARPQACVRDYGLARGVRVPVPSACLAPWGQKGLRAVAARLRVSAPSRDAAPSVPPGPTDLALCVAGPRSVF